MKSKCCLCEKKAQLLAEKILFESQVFCIIYDKVVHNEEKEQVREPNEIKITASFAMNLYIDELSLQLKLPFFLLALIPTIF